MEMEYLLFLQNIREQLGPVFETLVTWFSDGSLTVSFFLPFLIYWVVNKEDGLFILTNYSIGRAVNGLAKVTACIYRPWIIDERIHPSDAAKEAATGYSFPSGHTTQATATLGSISVTTKKTWLKCICWIAIALVMLSRNYLSVHTPKDVLVGFGLTAFIILITKHFWNWLKEHKGNMSKILGVVFLICVAGLAYTYFKTYPESAYVDTKAMQRDTFKEIGNLLGFTTGVYLEMKFVNFETKDINKKNVVLRILVGTLFVGVSEIGLGTLVSIMDGRIAKFLIYFIVAIIGTFLVPLVFTKMEMYKQIDKH